MFLIRNGYVVLLCILLLISPIDLGAEENELTAQEKFLQNFRQLTYEGKRSGEGYFSPDSSKLIFQSERIPGNPFFQIYILDFTNGNIHRVSPGFGKTTCAYFRPQSPEVLFASTHLDAAAEKKQQQELALRASGRKKRHKWDYDEHMDIFRSHQDGSNLQRLTDALGYDAEGAYSPDGKKIVFCSLRDAYPPQKLSAAEKKYFTRDIAYFGEIYIMNADGSEQKRLTTWPGYDGGPFFAPDGKRIIWRHFETNGRIADIYTMKLDGSDIRRLTNFQCMSWSPYFHPSGQYAIFTCNKLGFANFELFIVDAMGHRQPVRVTYREGFDGLPVFSPDGSKLCWTSNNTENKTSQLFIADWNHEQALAVLNSAPVNKDRRPAKLEKSSDTTSLAVEISETDLQAHVSFLAADKLCGRMTGSQGTQLAAEYLISQMQRHQLRPLGKLTSYRQQFPFTSGIKIIRSKNSFESDDGTKRVWQLNTDYRPLGFTANGAVKGQVVFAGYGLVVPGTQGYNSYTDLQVRDKIVLILRYIPEKLPLKQRQRMNRYASLRYKAMVARERGAKCLLVVNGPNSGKKGLIPLAFDKSLAGSNILAFSISSTLADSLLRHSGTELRELQTSLDQNSSPTQGFVLPKVRVRLSAAIKKMASTDYNIIGVLPPVNSQVDEYVMLGAHYDHIGRGDIDSLARKGEEGQIHNGADDNASGTAVVLELIASLSQKRQTEPNTLQRGIVFAFWSGEELGLIGSAHFAEHPPIPLCKIIAYVNFDMVGRLRKNKLIIQGLGSSSVWRKLIERKNIIAGFRLSLQEDPYLPTDVTAFYPRKIPVLSFFTGSHQDYNRPTDDSETLNYRGLKRITNFAQLLVMELSQNARPDYKIVKDTRAHKGKMARRIYLGTIPDFASANVKGVKIAGVQANGPADKAGLQQGDIIIELAGQKITNLYDYAYVLNALKSGKTVKISIMRKQKKLQLDITPQFRK